MEGLPRTTALKISLKDWLAARGGGGEGTKRREGGPARQRQKERNEDDNGLTMNVISSKDILVTRVEQGGNSQVEKHTTGATSGTLRGGGQEK